MENKTLSGLRILTFRALLARRSSVSGSRSLHAGKLAGREEM